MAGKIVLAALLLATAACASTPEGEEEWRPETLLRSDVPLWVESSGPNITPRHISGNGIGCTGDDWHFFGEWKQTYTPDEYGDGPDPVWWRLYSGGSFHCGGHFSSGEDREAHDVSEPGFIVNLGRDAQSGLDLVAWEIGMRGGSAYLLLAAAPGERASYSVLDADCAFGTTRKADGSSSYVTEYCAIPSREALRATAVAAAKRKPLGAMTSALAETITPTE